MEASFLDQEFGSYSVLVASDQNIELHIDQRSWLNQDSANTALSAAVRRVSSSPERCECMRCDIAHLPAWARSGDPVTVNPNTRKGGSLMPEHLVMSIGYAVTVVIDCR